MSRSVVFTPEAEDQLAELYRYIAARGRPKSRRNIAVQLGELIFRLGREDDAGLSHRSPACSADSRARTCAVRQAREEVAAAVAYAATTSSRTTGFNSLIAGERSQALADHLTFAGVFP